MIRARIPLWGWLLTLAIAGLLIIITAGELRRRYKAKWPW